MRIRSVSVGPDLVEAVVVFAEGEPLRTSEGGDAMGVLALLPGLQGHRCENADGRTFSEELADTELAHVLEHVALEVMALAGSPATLRGETVWDFRGDGHGVFRVRLQYDDDLVALGALRVAGRVVRWVLGQAEAPDVAVETQRLRALRTSPRKQRLRARRVMVKDRTWQVVGVVLRVAAALAIAGLLLGWAFVGYHDREWGGLAGAVLAPAIVAAELGIETWIWRRDQRG